MSVRTLQRQYNSSLYERIALSRDKSYLFEARQKRFTFNEDNFFVDLVTYNRLYIDSYIGLMHTLFALEDMYGLKIGEIDGEVCLRLDKSTKSTYTTIFDMFYTWQQEAAKLENGEITKEAYDKWRYKYPELDSTVSRAKVPSQGLSDMLMSELKKEDKKSKNSKKK